MGMDIESNVLGRLMATRSGDRWNDGHEGMIVSC